MDPRFLQQKLHMRQLRMVRALAERGSLSAAARSLHLTQPALTKALQDLERLMQAPLFERGSGGVRPTAAGVAFLDFADQTLAGVERLGERFERLAASDPQLVVLGALPVTGAGLLPRVISRVRHAHPGLELRLVVERTDTLLPKLLAGEVDLVLGRLYPPELPDGLERRALYEEPLAVLARAGHSLFASPVVGPRDLAGWDIILPTFGQRLGREIEHLAADLGLQPSPRLLRSNSNLMIRELLHGSDTLALAPGMLMAGALAAGDLGIVPIKLPRGSRLAGLIVSPLRPLSPSSERVVEVVRSEVDALARAHPAITTAHG